MTSDQATPVKTRAVSYRNLTFATLVAAAAALLINVLLYLLGKLFGAFPPSVQVQGQPFTVVPVIIFSFFPVIIAALVFLLLVRFTAQPKRTFYLVAAVIFISRSILKTKFEFHKLELATYLKYDRLRQIKFCLASEDIDRC